jgi:hypothetical protein
MSVGSVRKGITQAKFNEDASSIIHGEILILSVIFGVIFSSWYVFGAMLLGMIICLFIPIINILMGVCFSVLWALISAAIASYFQDVNLDDVTVIWDIFTVIGISTIFSTPASQIVGSLFFLSGLGLHLGAIEWTRDLTDTEDRNL